MSTAARHPLWSAVFAAVVVAAAGGLWKGAGSVVDRHEPSERTLATFRVPTVSPARDCAAARVMGVCLTLLVRRRDGSYTYDPIARAGQTVDALLLMQTGVALRATDIKPPIQQLQVGVLLPQGAGLVPGTTRLDVRGLTLQPGIDPGQMLATKGLTFTDVSQEAKLEIRFRLRVGDAKSVKAPQRLRLVGYAYPGMELDGEPPKGGVPYPGPRFYRSWLNVGVPGRVSERDLKGSPTPWLTFPWSLRTAVIDHERKALIRQDTRRQTRLGDVRTQYIAEIIDELIQATPRPPSLRDAVRQALLLPLDGAGTSENRAALQREGELAAGPGFYRPTFRCVKPTDCPGPRFVTLNAYENTSGWGNELLFFDGYNTQEFVNRRREPYRNVISVRRGDILRFRILIDNAADFPGQPGRAGGDPRSVVEGIPEPSSVATGVRLRVTIPTGSAYELALRATLQAANSRPRVIDDGVLVRSSEWVRLEYIKGSATLSNTNVAASSQPIDDAFTRTAKLLGAGGTDGRFGGSFRDARIAEFSVRVRRGR